MNLARMVRVPIYHWLREGRKGSGIAYSTAAYFYWLAREGSRYVGTRIVEISWVLNQLRNHAQGGERVLQIGDVLLYKALHKYEVELVDLEAEEKSRPGLKVHKTDIRDIRLRQDYFDIAISISTLEHIGVQQPKFTNGDKLAVDIISQALKPGGWFLLTVPFGKPVVPAEFRVYDEARLDFLVRDKFSIEEKNFLIWNKFKWQKVSSAAAERIGFARNNPSMILGVALLKARKR